MVSVRNAGDTMEPIRAVGADIEMFMRRLLHRATFSFQLLLRNIHHLVLVIELVHGAAGTLDSLGGRTLAVALIERVISAGLAAAGGWRVRVGNRTFLGTVHLGTCLAVVFIIFALKVIICILLDDLGGSAALSMPLLS